MRTVFHITTKGHWAKAIENGQYQVESLQKEGFIHLSRPHQVLRVANFLFKGKKDLVLLWVNQDKVKNPIKYEGETEQSEKFPHVYGVLNLDAIIDVFDFIESEQGFSLPKPFFLQEEHLIRPAHIDDAAEIANCHTHTWRESYRGQIKEETLEQRPLLFRNIFSNWQKVLQSTELLQKTWVVESRDHGIVGFCGTALAREEKWKSFGEITVIYIFEQYKKMGFGRILIKEALHFFKAQNIHKVLVWVLKTNTAAIKFYEKSGAQLIAEEKVEKVHGEELPHVALFWNLN